MVGDFIVPPYEFLPSHSLGVLVGVLRALLDVLVEQRAPVRDEQSV